MDYYNDPVFIASLDQNVLKLLAETVKENPDDLNSRLKYAVALEYDGNIHDAIYELKYIIDNSQTASNELVYKVIGLMEDVNDPDLLNFAKNYLDSIKDSDYYLCVIRLLLNNDNIHDAKKATSVHRSLNLDNFSHFAVSSFLSNKEGKIIASLRDAVKYRKNGGDISGFNFLVGNLFLANQQYQKALNYFFTSLENNPDWEGLAFTIGYIYYMQLDFSKAINYFEQALLLSPNSKRYLSYLFFSILQVFTYKEAVIKAEEMLKRNPHSSSLKRLLAYIAYCWGNKSLKSFRYIDGFRAVRKLNDLTILAKSELGYPVRNGNIDKSIVYEIDHLKDFIT